MYGLDMSTIYFTRRISKIIIITFLVFSLGLKGGPWGKCGNRAQSPAFGVSHKLLLPKSSLPLDYIN